MSLYVSVTVNCDGDESPAGRAPTQDATDLGTVVKPGCPWHFDTGFESKVQARQLAKARGWGRVVVDGRSLDLCPACLARYRIGAAS